MYSGDSMAEDFQLQLRKKALDEQIKRLPLDQSTQAQARAHVKKLSMGAYRATTSYLNTLEEIVTLAGFGKNDTLMQSYVCQAICALWSDDEATNQARRKHANELKIALNDNKANLQTFHAAIFDLERPIRRPIKKALSAFWHKASPRQKAAGIRALLSGVPIDARADLNRLNCCYAKTVSDILGNRTLPTEKEIVLETDPDERSTELRTFSRVN